MTPAGLSWGRVRGRVEIDPRVLSAETLSIGYGPGVRWIFVFVGLWLALGTTPAWADSLTVHDEDRWRGSSVWPRSSVLDTASGDKVTMSGGPGRLSITASSNIEYVNFRLDFEGPGEAGRLERGVYPDAQPAGARQLDHAGLGFDASYYYAWSSCKREKKEIIH